jgi:hypothetical protein
MPTPWSVWRLVVFTQEPFGRFATTARPPFASVNSESLIDFAKTRNITPRVLMDLGLIHDVESFGPLLEAVLSMHTPYPVYRLPEVDGGNLAPEVDSTEYPICAGEWQLARDCQLYLDKIPVEVSGLLATFMDDADPKQDAKDIVYCILWGI